MKFLFKLINKNRINDALDYYNNSIGSTKRFRKFEDVLLLHKLNKYEPEHFMSIEINRGFSYFIAHECMELFINLDLKGSKAFHMHDKQDMNLRNTFVYLHCNYDTEDNLSHPMYFDNELRSINPVINRIWKFVKDVNIKKIAQEDRDEFKEIHHDMYNLIHAYHETDYVYNSNSTIHSKIKDVIRVYDMMKLEKIY